MRLIPDTGRPPRLAILAAGEIFGGAERQILTLSGELASAGESPLLIAFHDNQLADDARRLGMNVLVLGARGLIDIRAVRHLRMALCEHAIETVSVHGYRSSVYLALAMAGRSIRVVKTEHGSVELHGDGQLQRVRPWLYRWLENVSTRLLRALVVYVTQELQSRCLGEHRGLQQHVIYNGLSPPDRASTARPPDFRSETINLVAVGRLDPVKGIDIAVRSLSQPEMPSQVQLYVVGSGPEQSALADLARDLGVGARVSFIGFRNNVYDYIAHADALLMPSRHEGLPYTLLEALSLGTPVIASRVGGLAEVLTDRQTALLVEPGNQTELAKAVRNLVSAPELREQLVRNGRDLVREKFTAGEMTRRYRLLFQPTAPTQAGG